ncbi:AAA family ATPase [Candidatus Dojkabacteria bacterium]|jgi:hypothetical protein|nr:AAA family ATPase [Candidatus Dojkabacteria bacterium]
MNAFSCKFRDIYKFNEISDKEYELICWEYNKIVNSYSIKTELYSNLVWDFLSKSFDITERNFIVYSDIEIDEKNHTHKSYHYVVKCNIDTSNFIYLSFNDEKKAYDDDDYIGYVTEDDKMDKIYNLNIYYDSSVFSTNRLEEEIVDKLLSCSYLPSLENQFFTIKRTQFGYGLKASYIKKMNIDIKLNYGKKFVNIHDKILDKLRKYNYGLFLFHGVSGSGKSTYLRKLISELSKEKTIIYMPSYMIESVTDPEFISFIGSFKNPILLLEDAENVLGMSNSNRNQAVSNILNMTDGLLNDFMNVQIIATFNSKTKLIDEALKRAGRLQVNYKFSELSATEATLLSESIGLNVKYTKPTVLSEIYEGTNQIIMDDLDEKTPGFKIGNK